MLGPRSYSSHGNSRTKKNKGISNLLQNKSNTADPNDIWIDMEDVEDVEDVEDEFSEEKDFFGNLVCLPCSVKGVSESADIKFHKIRGTFRQGYGTSRASVFRKQAEKRKLDEAAATSKNLTDFFRHSVDESFSDDDSSADELDEFSCYTSTDKKVKKKRALGFKYTPTRAIDILTKSLAKPTKDREFEKKNSFFDRTVARCIVDFLQVRRDSRIGRVAASICVAYHQFQKSKTKDSYRAQCIREWAQNYLLNGELPKFKQGQHVKTQTIITDELVQEQLRTELRAFPDFERTPLNFMNALNDRILATIPKAPDTICEETARRWMIYLGFSLTKMQKNYYTDEHNREDNTAYRNDVFLPLMANYEKRMTKYLIDESGNITIEEPTRLPGEIWLEVVLITHDESTFYSNECKSVVWMENGYAN
jgi:hypothetical protein